MEYINKLAGDGVTQPQSKGMLPPGQSEYHNDTGTDNVGTSYSWKRNTASSDANNFEGGQSGLYNGNGDCDYIKLHRSIQVMGFFLGGSFPGGATISSSQSSSIWESDPLYDNVVGASFNDMTIHGTAFSCEFSETATIYDENRVYQPCTYIEFNYTS